MKKSNTNKLNNKFLLFTLSLLLLVTPIFSACNNNSEVMQDGFFSAVAADFDEHGWKEYVTIFVSNNTIITVEYNAKNASGFIKSWDMEYMRTMNRVDGTYPNEYTRLYANALIKMQSTGGIDAITGATHSHASFIMLADAAIAQAFAGDHNVAFVVFPEASEE